MMMKHEGLILTGAIALSATVFAADDVVVKDVCTPTETSSVRVGGKPGLLIDSSIDVRAYSDWARTTVYEEAANAFATHWDDAEPGRAGWQNEYWGKTMLSYAGAIAYTRDPELTKWALDRVHEFVAKYQQSNGYLSTYREDNIGVRTKEANPHKTWNFNTWGRKYTLWALVEMYRATGDDACLDAAEKLADHLCAQLKRLNVGIEWTGSWAGLSAMTILKPILLLNRERPKAEYRALADHIVSVTDREGADAIDMNLIRLALSDKPVHTWFGDRAMYLAKAYELQSFFEGVAEQYRVTGEPRLLAAVKAFHRHLVDDELNGMRSVGYFDHFLNARKRVNAMTELCDVTHWIRLNRELYLLTGETAYLDCIEEAFYNAFLAGVSPDGSWGAHIVRGHGTRHLAAPPQTGMRHHQCCPDNMMRTYFDWAATVAD
ncbi:MAG: glycoside hydrolase family 127 protein, partial [Verrucomicrobiota bacterium]|nr:glycoside hydrolase family 127 protein [Verrucomicrobiota bacterium]